MRSTSSLDHRDLGLRSRCPSPRWPARIVVAAVRGRYRSRPDTSADRSRSSPASPRRAPCAPAPRGSRRPSRRPIDRRGAGAPASTRGRMLEGRASTSRRHPAPGARPPPVQRRRGRPVVEGRLQGGGDPGGTSAAHGSGRGLPRPGCRRGRPAFRMASFMTSICLSCVGF